MAKVLVVDDHPANRALITTLLVYAGHQAIEAADGLEALERVRADHPDLVVCDILMPAMDGYQFVRQLRTEPAIAGTPVIFCTATFMEHEARRLASDCGVPQVLLKPCEPEAILRAIEAGLQQRPADLPVSAPGDFDRAHLRLVTDKLVVKVQELEASNRRLSALTELNLELASEHDPYALLAKVCDGARRLLEADFSVLQVQAKQAGQPNHCAAAGLDRDSSTRLDGLPMDLGILGQVMQDRQSLRLNNPSGDPAGVGLPAAFPPLHNLLLSPIVSLHRAYGWLLLANQREEAAFSEEDARLLDIYTAQAGRIYENGSLYETMKRNAEQLRIEVAERERTAVDLRQLNESLEQRVERRTADLREVIEGLESFNRTVSHDLRGPLGGIAGVAKLARDSMLAGDGPRAEYLLGLIASRAATAEKLVGALLAMARASDTSLNRQPVAPGPMVQEVIDSLQAPDAAEPLPVRVGPLPESVMADPVLLRQVFVNLISNALKFAAPVAQPRIEVGSGGTPQQPVFFVRDNGVGFSPDQAARLFKPFQRLHGARFDGFGVGLSIVKRIIDRHGGALWAEGNPDGGACFFFVLDEPSGPATAASLI